MQDSQSRLGKVQEACVSVLATTKIAMVLPFTAAMVRIVHDNYSVAGLFTTTPIFMIVVALIMTGCFIPVCVGNMQTKLLLNRNLYPQDRSTVFACVMDFILDEDVMFYPLAIAAAVAFAFTATIAVPLMIGALACIAIQFMNWLRNKFVARLPGLEYEYDHIE